MSSSVLYLDPNSQHLFLNNKHTMANRVSNNQLEQLLEFLTEHPALARGVGLGARSKETVDKQWSDLAAKLNAYGSGSSKTGERWKKYWADLKHKTKSRLAKRRRDASGTGGGPSSQEDATDIEKKVLAIIGEQAVFGDIIHRVPVFNIEPLAQLSENIMVSQDIIIPSDVAENVADPVIVNSPSRRGQTCIVYNTPEFPVAINNSSAPTETQSQHVPQLSQTGLESPVSRPLLDRPRPRRIRPSITVPSRIEPQWVMELERCRVEYEKKLADAALITAEAARAQAAAAATQAAVAATQADTMRTLVELLRCQYDDVRAQMEFTREQASGLPPRDH